jgi:hypothetical protein
MGFSHDKATHHFRLLKDGGEIVVEANDPADKASIQQIQMHLGHIVSMFSDGNFKAPMLIHDTNPPGTATMTRLKSEIRYELTKTDRGAMIRITTSNPETTDAFMCFCFFKSWITRPVVSRPLEAKRRTTVVDFTPFFGRYALLGFFPAL